MGIIGESGCIKTTTAKFILLQEAPTAGTVVFDGQDIFSLESRALMAYRRSVQVVFQDPYSSLSPRMRIGPLLLASTPRLHELRTVRQIGFQEPALVEPLRVGDDAVLHDAGPLPAHAISPV
jgi:ABC-type microcin C transport system duplicated ATPase subunit YejF